MWRPAPGFELRKAKYSSRQPKDNDLGFAYEPRLLPATLRRAYVFELQVLRRDSMVYHNKRLLSCIKLLRALRRAHIQRLSEDTDLEKCHKSKGLEVGSAWNQRRVSDMSRSEASVMQLSTCPNRLKGI